MSTRKVLVARLDSLGDVLISGPAVRAIAASAEVVLLCSPQGRPAAELLPGVSDIICWQSPWTAATPPPVERDAVGSLVAAVSQREIGEAVILTSFHQSPLPLALLLRLAGVGRISGISTDYPGSLLDVRIRPGEDLREDLPEPERALQVAVAAGFALPAGDDGRLAVSMAVPRLSPTGGARTIVVHPGADAPARRWPAAQHRAVVELLADAGWQVLVTGGPEETALTAMVAGRRGVDLGGRLTVAELAAVLSCADAIVVGNTGPAHLAAAVGTPVVSLFAPVVSLRCWQPYGVACVVLGDQSAACRGTRARTCPIAGHPCLASVTPGQALAAVRTVVRQAEQARGEAAS